LATKKLSIIIPYYNSLTKLVRLLNSIPTKNTNLEVIIIDDHSDKEFRTENIQQDFEECIFVKNSTVSKGAGSARNKGLKLASGKWLLFADADDFFINTPFEFILSFLDFNENVDIIYYPPTSIIEGTENKSERHLVYEKLVNNHFSTKGDEIKYKYHSPCSKLIKRKLIEKHSIQFDEVVAGNDLMFSLKSGHFANVIQVRKEIIYCITKSEGSLTTTFSKENFLSRFFVTMRQNDFLRLVDKSKYEVGMLSFVWRARKHGVYLMLKVFFKILFKYKLWSK
jgi:glycosyltransferase involved in cell wall biosynthesis